MNRPESQPTLDYSTRRNWRENAWVRRWMRVPPVVTGLLLYVMLWAVGLRFLSSSFENPFYPLHEYVTPWLYFVAFCIPGALRRLDWRHLLMMAGLGVLLYGMNTAALWVTRRLPGLDGWFVGPLYMLLLITGVECVLQQRRQVPLVWTVALAVAGAGLMAVMRLMLECSTESVEIAWMHTIIPWSSVFYYPLLIAAAWTIVPLGQRVAALRGSGGRLAVASGIVGVIAVSLLFAHVWIYALALGSLNGGGPFRRDAALGILDIRGAPDDIREMQRLLMAADWSQPPDTGLLNYDYRRADIAYLGRRDPAETARLLSRMLREKPTRTLAEFSAELLAGQKRFETVPILLRYALLGNDDCSKALVRMKIPYAILVALIDIVRAQRQVVGGSGDFRLNTWSHDDLVAQAGTDAGPNLHDWTAFCDDRLRSLPTPLSAEQTAEGDRVLAIFTRYWQVNSAQESAARAHLTVAPPDWDVPTTDDLEREVDQYADRMQAGIRKFRPSATVPATRP